MEFNNSKRMELINTMVTELPVLRARIGASQADISEKIGISRQTYNYKENGKSLFNIEETARVVSFLNLTFDEINEIFFDNAILK